MSPRSLRTVLFACVCMLIIGAPAAAAARQVRIGKPPRRPAGARSLGTLPSATTLPVTVTLKSRDPASLAAYAAAVSTPGSADYHNYLSVGQFRQRFGSTSSDIAAVQSSLRAHVLHPGPVSANGLAVSVSAPAGTIEQSFSTPLERIALPGGRTAFANTQAPLVDQSVAAAVQGVVGLDSLSAPQPLSLRAVRAVGAASSRGASGASSGAVGGSGADRPHVVTGGPQPCQAATSAAANQPTAYTADQIASAYGVPSLYGAGDQGAGQTIAVYELEPNVRTDIPAFQHCYGTNASVSYVQVDGGPGPVDFGQGAETALDLDALIGLAPKANVIVYQGPDSTSHAPGAGPYDTYNAIISQNTASIIATSWGACEQDIGSANAQAENTLFQEAAVQGQTIVAAAGDDGSEDCLASDGSNSLAVDDPGSQPFVTSVGGTSLSLTPARGETVWNNSQGAGGGGVSTLWPMPSYQSGAPASLNVAASHSSACGAASGLCREVPDVSADADPRTGYLVYYAGSWTRLGGTSGSGPTWAAMLALANASSFCGGARLGFANPALYRAAAGNYAANFADVTTGENDFTANHGLYSAGPGYDMASGLGSPNLTNLSSGLCDKPVTVNSPGPQTSLIGTSHSVQIQAAGAIGGPLSFFASGLPPGLSINRSNGLISGAAASSGTYTVTVGAADSQGFIGSTSFTWTIDLATVTIANPGDQAGRIGQLAGLQLHAQANNGGAVAYSATGLPPGLVLGGLSGVISGKLSAVGSGVVTLTATTSGGVPARTQIRWTVRGYPGIAGSSLAGVGQGKPKLSVMVTAGTFAPALKTVSISIPRQFTFTGKRRGIFVTAPGGKRLLFTKLVRKGVLTITLRAVATTCQISVGSPALRATRAIATAIKKKHRRPSLTLTVTATDASGLATRLPLKLKPSS